MPREVNCDDGSGDLFGNLKADVNVTRQARRRTAADELRILVFTGVRILPRTPFTRRAQSRFVAQQQTGCIWLAAAPRCLCASQSETAFNNFHRQIENLPARLSAGINFDFKE